jgi:hypothetical protein
MCCYKKFGSTDDRLCCDTFLRQQLLAQQSFQSRRNTLSQGFSTLKKIFARCVLTL